MLIEEEMDIETEVVGDIKEDEDTEADEKKEVKDMVLVIYVVLIIGKRTT
jgi:hypothetical protein